MFPGSGDAANRRRATSAQRETNFKVVLVGESGAGKTWLARRLLGEPLSGARATAAATATADFFACSRWRAGRRVRVVLWDTAGAPAYRAVLPNYFHFAHAIVVVYDFTDLRSLLQVPEWVALARSHGARAAQLHVLGCKSDLLARRALSAGGAAAALEPLRRAGVPTFEVSALTGHGVERWFGALLDAMQARREAFRREMRLYDPTYEDSIVLSRSPPPSRTTSTCFGMSLSHSPSPPSSHPSPSSSSSSKSEERVREPDWTGVTPHSAHASYQLAQDKCAAAAERLSRLLPFPGEDEDARRPAGRRSVERQAGTSTPLGGKGTAND